MIQKVSRDFVLFCFGVVACFVFEGRRVLVIYLDASLAVVGALGEKSIGQDGVGAGECLTDRGDGDGDSLLEHGGHGEVCVCMGREEWDRDKEEERGEEEKKVSGRRNEGREK